MEHKGDCTGHCCIPIEATEDMPPSACNNRDTQQPSFLLPLAEEYAGIVKKLEAIETTERIRSLPNLIERAPPLEIDDLALVPAAVPTPEATVATTPDVSENGIHSSTDPHCKEVKVTFKEDGCHASLARRNLRTFSLSMFPTASMSGAKKIDLLLLTTLDVGNNELMDLPGLSALPNLRNLNLTRNWFNTLPIEIDSCTKLISLNASRNFFKPNEQSLRLTALRTHLPELSTLDLTYNQKCGREAHRALVQSQVPKLKDIRMTVWEKVSSAPGAYVGSSAAERDATVLRSQLEPLGTVNLRRRLVTDFGQVPTDPATVDRAGVMDRLLSCYEKEGMLVHSQHGMVNNDGRGQRRVIHVEGTLLGQELIDALLVELRAWNGDRERGGSSKNRERPSIKAISYMILRSPHAHTQKLEGQTAAPLSRRALRSMKKFERNHKLWELAQAAMIEVDPEFAKRCTEIAITHGFSGSPHIDKQNCGPFYGLALGNFSDGTGGVSVECSARVVAMVNTKNRLGRVDGRYPHWVAPYDASAERYSLIYYETGGKFVEPGPAIFSMPKEMGETDQ